MNIEIYHLLEGADQAKGLAVVIDVFRAFPWNAICFPEACRKYMPLAEKKRRGS